MAGPPQISDPSFVQERETPIVDNTTGKLIATAAQIGVQGVTAYQSRKLRDEISAERDKFLGVEGEELQGAVGLDGTDDLSQDIITKDINELVEGANTETVAVDLREITAMEGDINNALRAVQQGISPIRALEVNAEAITRRYIDRFPGLARQFQQVAQTALGTSNNLLTATMRAQQELFDANEAAAKGLAGQRDLLADAAFDAGFVQAKFGPTVEIRGEAMTQYLAAAQRESAITLLNQREELAISRGEVGPAQAAFNGRIRHTQNLATLDLSNAIVNLLPPELQSSGVAGLSTFLRVTDDPETIVAMQQSLEASKAAAIFTVADRLRNSGYISEAQKSSVTELQDMIGGVYDVMIDSISTKAVSEELKYQLDALTNLYGLEFQQLFGRDALFAKEFLAVVPVDSNLHQLISRNMVSQGILSRMMDYYGEGNINTALIPGLVDEGIAPDSPEGKEALSAVNNAAIGSFRAFLTDPNAALASQYKPVKMLKGMDIQFAEMAPDVKRNMLEMLGMDQWDQMLQQGVSPEIQQVMDRLNRQVTEWGAVKLNDAVEDFVRDIGDPSMAGRFKIRTDTGTAGSIVGLGAQRPIPTRDLVTLEEGPRGIMFVAKTTAEYGEMGLATDPQNLGNISQMVASLNNIHGQGINAWARAMGNLGVGNSRKNVLRNVIDTLMPPEKKDAEAE